MALKSRYQSEYLVKVLVLEEEEEEEAVRDDGVASVEVDMDQEKMVDELEVVALDHKMEVVDNEDDAYPLVSCELEEMAYPWEVEALDEIEVGVDMA